MRAVFSGGIMPTISDDDLQKQPWGTNISADVNSVAAEGFRAMLTPSGALKVSNVGPTMGGGLVSCHRPFYGMLGTTPMPYIMVQADRYFADYELPNVGRDEFDLKCVFKSGSAAPCANTANFSTQNNRSNGQWQLDPTGKVWVDTGFKPTTEANAWFTTRYRFIMGPTTWGVLSVDWDNQHFDAPAQFQNLPYLTSNWAVSSSLQAQTETMNAGAVTVLYHRISIKSSDQPFA
jgi:hypothetical protein